MTAADLFPALAAHVTRVQATSGSLHGLHCLSGLQLCVVSMCDCPAVQV